MGFWALSHPLQADPTHEALGSNRELTAVLWGDGGESYLTQHPAINKDTDLHFFFSEFLFSHAEVEMVGWHHRHNGSESEQTPGDSEGRGSLVCDSSWGRKESDTA